MSRMTFFPTTRAGKVRTLAVLLVGVALAALMPRALLWKTPHTLPGRPEPVVFTTATPDPSYDPNRFEMTSADTTTSKLYQWFPVGKAEHTDTGTRDNWEVAITAAGVAAHLAGGPAPATGLPIWRTGPGQMADTAGLRNKDILVGIGQVPTPDFDHFLTAIRTYRGTDVTLSVVRAGKTLTLPAHLAGPGDVGNPFGFSFQPPVPTATPVIMPVDDGGEGNSGGLMTTLAYLDATTPGDLSGGMKVTGTGAIDADGTVEEIGEPDLKVQGAAKAHADVFFVPAGDNAETANQAVADHHLNITVVPVTSAVQALAWLCDHGGVSPACANAR